MRHPLAPPAPGRLQFSPARVFLHTLPFAMVLTILSPPLAVQLSGNVAILSGYVSMLAVEFWHLRLAMMRAADAFPTTTHIPQATQATSAVKVLAIVMLALIALVVIMVFALLGYVAWRLLSEPRPHRVA